MPELSGQRGFSTFSIQKNTKPRCCAFLTIGNYVKNATGDGAVITISVDSVAIWERSSVAR